MKYSTVSHLRSREHSQSRKPSEFYGGNIVHVQRRKPRKHRENTRVFHHGKPGFYGDGVSLLRRLASLSVGRPRGSYILLLAIGS